MGRLEELTNLESDSSGGRQRKAVGLFGKDIAGSSLFEAALLSTASGVVLPIQQLNPVFGSLYTSLATIINTASQATIFVPPSNQRWVLKDLIVGSMGNAQVQMWSGGSVKIPYISLATAGGYLSNFGDSGLRGTALNDCLAFNVQPSGATVAISLNLRFDPV